VVSDGHTQASEAPQASTAAWKVQRDMDLPSVPGKPAKSIPGNGMVEVAAFHELSDQHGLLPLQQQQRQNQGSENCSSNKITTKTCLCNIFHWCHSQQGRYTEKLDFSKNVTGWKNH